MALDVTDYSSNSNDLTNVNGVAEETTIVPNANILTSALFDKDTDTVLQRDDTDLTGWNLDSTGKFTTEFWLRFITASNYPLLISKSASNTIVSQREMFAMLFPSGANAQLYAFVTDGTLGDFYYYSTVLNPNTWYHIAVTCDTSQPSASTFEFFINGSSIGNGTASNAGNASGINSYDTPLYIGGDWSNNQSLEGYLADVRIWNDVRTSTEISDNYQNHLSDPTSEANLVAYYPFEAVGGGGGASPIFVPQQGRRGRW